MEPWRLTQSICNTGGIFLPADFLVASLGKRASSWNRTGLLVAAADWNEDVWWRQAVIRQRSCSAFIYVLRKGAESPCRETGLGCHPSPSPLFEMQGALPILETSSRCPTTVGFPSRGFFMLEITRTVDVACVLSHSLLCFVFWQWLNSLDRIWVSAHILVSERFNDSRSKYCIVHFFFSPFIF